MASALEDVGSKLQAEFDRFDTFAKRLERELSVWHLPERRGTSAEANAQFAGVNASIDALRDRCRQSEADLKKSIESACGTDEIGEVLGAAEAARTDAPLLAQEAVRLATKKVDVADLAIVELKAIPDELEKAAEAVVAKVREDLERIGCGLAAQAGYPYGNLEAAERQLDHLARHVNVRSRAALAAAADARAEHAAACHTASEARGNLVLAKKLLVEVARKALAG